jgi:beta-lactamase regulating signal transducer with metallopeptidase domain
MMWFDATPIASATVEALFNCLWQGLLLCGLVACALAMSRGTNAATRYAIWWATLVATACLPLLPVAPPVRTPSRPVAIVQVVDPLPPIHRPATVVRMKPVQLPSEPKPSTPVATFRVRDRWPLALFCAWMLGVAVMLARIGWSFLYIRTLRRTATPLGQELYQSTRISTPMAVGFVHPIILIPEGFADRLNLAEFDQIVAHERAHIRRGDNWTNLIQKFIEAVMFFHPAVWFIAKRLNLERESACDDCVVHSTGAAQPYAACLAKLVEVTAARRQPALATGIFQGARQISIRIERLLDRTRNRTPHASRRTLMLALSGLVVAAVVFPQVRAALAGPLIQLPVARSQPVSQVQAAQVQKEKPPRRQNTELRRSLEQVLGELRGQIQDVQLAAEPVLEGLQSQEIQVPDNDDQLRALREQLANVEQSGNFAQLDSHLKDLNNQLLAAQESMRDAEKASISQRSSGWWTGLNTRTKGQIEFTDDDADVKSVSPGGYLSIEERRGWTTRKYEVTPTERRYMVNGHSETLDGDGRKWLAETLPQVIRDSAIGADARVKRILKQQGPAGVLDEISKILSDHNKRVYFGELFANGPLAADILQRAARQMGRQIVSDGEKARLLMDVSATYLKDGSARAEYFDAIGTIASDGEHRRVLSNVLQKDGRTKETLLLTLKSAKGIASDGEKARLLMEAADAPSFNDSVSAEYLATVNTIASDGEHARVLMALLRNGNATKETLVPAMKSAARIASDGEKARVLVRAADFYTADPAIRSAFFNAAGGIASDGEKSRVLMAILARSNLDKEGFIELIRTAARIASDGEKGRVLRSVASTCPNDDAVVSALVQAVSTISSDGEYRRVMSAMLGRSDLSARITAIKHI